jgi:hypothetical protein
MGLEHQNNPNLYALLNWLEIRNPDLAGQIQERLSEVEEAVWQLVISTMQSSTEQKSMSPQQDISDMNQTTQRLLSELINILQSK